MDTPGMFRWAKGISHMEGYLPGNLAYINNNPGDFRATPRWDGRPSSAYMRSLGAIGCHSGFAVFPTPEAGFAALYQFLRDARANQLIAYRAYAQRIGRPGGICTLGDFFQVYAPSSDRNNPNRYALNVADYIGNGVTVGTPINLI